MKLRPPQLDLATDDVNRLTLQGTTDWGELLDFTKNSS